MNRSNLRLEGDVARSLLRAGLLYNVHGVKRADDELVALFHIPFGDDASPYDVWAYLASTLFVAASACSFGDSDIRTAAGDLIATIPLVRIVPDVSATSVHWVEAYSVVPAHGWEAPDLVAHPVYAVSTAVRKLREAFPKDFAVVTPDDVRIIDAPLFARSLDESAPK